MGKKVYFNKGISMIEIIIVLALIGIIAIFSISVDINSLQRYSFRNERDILVSSLQKARNQAMNNVCFGTCVANTGMPHGVNFSSGKYTIFQGNTYDSTDIFNEDVVINPSISIPNFTVIFSQFSGDVSTGTGEITISDNMNHSSLISINSEGRISWTN